MFKLWHQLFLDERPSIGLAFFRIFAALTTGLHVIPLFFHLEDNFFVSTSIRELNGSFFTVDVLKWVSQSPDNVVAMMAALFCVSCLLFLIGLWSQISCIVMTLCCYYFYALNSFQIGTLSWDILLVTLVLLCLTPYHGDYFSVDALYTKHPAPYARRRPYFIQRLLQLQLASTFFYTALYKTTAEGNWITGNPLYYLMNYPAPGVVKHFLLKEWFSTQPQLCYALGIFIVVAEFLIPFLLFFKPTRNSAIYAGIVFHILLILTMDVPAIFFFLFPAQFLLFINSEDILRWVEERRRRNKNAPRDKVVFDGKCGFCRESVRKLRVMDLWGSVEYTDLHAQEDVSALHPQLTKDKAMSQMHVIETDGSLFAGFFGLRRLCLKMPMLYALLPVVYFPGAGLIGPVVYGFIAKNRYLLHGNRVCKDNACYRA